MTNHKVSVTDHRLVAFWTERHLCTVSTVNPDGSLHATPMGIVLVPADNQAWGITSRISVKARNLAANPQIAVCQLEGRWWSTLTGTGHVETDPEVIAEAERRYAGRYRQPRVNPERVAVRIDIHHVLANLPA